MLGHTARRLQSAALMLLFTSGAVSAQEIALEGIVVTYSRVEESAIDALAASSAVGKQQLDQQFQPDRVSEVLRTIPGVTTTETARDTAQSINIRGLQDFGRVNVLIEGARQNFQRSGHSANGAFYIEPEMMKRVDITRGPTATIYGSGAIGGVANFELLDADDILKPGEYAAVRSRSRYSSNGDGLMQSGTGAVRVGNFDILGQVNGRWTNDFEDGSGNRVPDSSDTTKSELVKARWRPAAGHQITGTFIDYTSEFVDRPTAASTVRRDSEVNNTQFTLGYTYARPETPLLDFSAKYYNNRTGLDQVRLTNSIFEPLGSRRSFDIETNGVDVFNTSRFSFGSAKLALTYGGDWFEDKVVTNDPNGNGDEFTPGGRRTVYGSFIQSHATFFEIVDIIGALRYDHYELNGGGNSSEGERVSPKITAGVTPFKGTTFYATYAEGYRAPAVTETLVSGLHPPPATFNLLPNPNLVPEVAHNLEGGVNLKYDRIFTARDAFRAKVSVFRNKIDDFIDAEYIDVNNDSFPPANNFTDDTFQYVNIANATIRGAELELMYDARDWFLGVGAHHIRGKNETTGEGLYSIPADQLTLTVGFRAMEDKLVAGTRTRFVADQHRIPSPSAVTVFEAADAYTVVDLFASYQLNDNAVVTLNIDNLFDVTYRPYLYQSNEPGFAARVGLTMRLGAE